MFYSISYSTNPKEIGPEYPQAGPSKDYDRRSPNSYQNVNPTQFPDFIPNLDYFTIHPKAPLTDFVSSGLHHGLLLSQRVKDTLEKFKLVPNRFYPLALKQGTNSYNYYWMHIISDLSDYVNYKKSRFYISDYLKKLREIDISTKGEFLFTRSQMMESKEDRFKTVYASEIKLLPDFFSLELDLFAISSFDNKKYISERLRTAFITIPFTGIDINPSSLS